MRTKVKIFCAIAIIAICLLTWLRYSTTPQANAPSQSEDVLTNQSMQPKQAKVIENRQTPKVAGGVIAMQTVPIAHNEDTNASKTRMLQTWQAPIEFYGKVIDEHSNAVSGAQVVFHWAETPDEAGNKNVTINSDAEGMFSLHDAKGPDLTVSVSKDGYYSSREKDHPAFKYGAFAIGNFSPDPQNPIVFHLKKKGTSETLIERSFPAGMGQIVKLKHDGTPVEIDLLNGQKVASGAGQLKLELWRDISHKNANAYDWKLQLSTLGGGIVKADDEFAFEAPQVGYQPSIVVDMMATNQNWREDIKSKFYIHLPDGKYGLIDLYFLSYNGVIKIKSIINPAGSRNLESNN